MATQVESTQAIQYHRPYQTGSIARLRWLWATLLGSAIILAPTLSFGLGYDHGFFHYMAWANLEKGLWPYKDVWDTAFPGIILFHWLALAVGGESVLAFRLLDWAIQLLTAGLLLFRLTSRIAGNHAGMLAAWLYATLYTTAGYYHTAQRDSFLIPFLLGGILLLWHYFEKEKFEQEDSQKGQRALLLAGAGLAFGIALLIRPTYGLIALAAAIAVFFAAPTLFAASGKHTNLGNRLRHAALFSTLCGLPLITFVLIYGLRGYFEPLMQIVTYLTVVYPDIERVDTRWVVFMAFTTAPRIL